MIGLTLPHHASNCQLEVILFLLSVSLELKLCVCVGLIASSDV